MERKKEEITLKSLDTKIDDVVRTIDDLAAATAAGFADVQKRFNSHDQRFESIDQRFDQIDEEIKLTRVEISNGLREIKEEIERLDARIDKLTKMTTGDVTVLIEEQEKIKLRLKKLELKNSQV